jgi:hypothetical protein
MRNYSKNKKRRFSKKPLIIILCLALLVIIAGSVYVFFFRDSSKPDNSRNTPETVNYDPPTKEEQEAGDIQKIKNIDGENDSTGSQSSPTIVLEASQYEDIVEIRAYITGIFEDNGQCKLSLRKDSSSITRTSTSFASATTTQCGAINIPVSEFPTSGEWQTIMEYTSNSTVSTSSIKKFMVRK